MSGSRAFVRVEGERTPHTRRDAMIYRSPPRKVTPARSQRGEPAGPGEWHPHIPEPLDQKGACQLARHRGAQGTGRTGASERESYSESLLYLPKWLAMDEFVIVPARSLLGGPLDPWPIWGLPVSASQVCASSDAVWPRPLFFWNCARARLVSGPKTPSSDPL